MKAKILTISAGLLFLAASCAVEDPQPPAVRNDNIITIQAVAEETPTDETRSIRLDNGDIWWTPGDQISVFYGSGADGGSCFTAQNTENQRITNFTGTIGVITGGGDISVDQTFFWGLYPYNATAECDGASLVTDVPDVQAATQGTFAPGVYPWIGKSQGLMMSFYGLCGGIKFTVNKEGIKKATMKSLDGSPLAGRVRIAVDANGIPSVQEVIDGKDEVVLEAPDGEYFIPGKYYFFVTLPHKFETSFYSVTFETFTEVGVYTRTRAQEIKRADFISFSSALDGKVTYEKKTGAIPVEDPAFKAYLVENFDTDEDGEISYEEAAVITKVRVSTSKNSTSEGVASVQGIEYMEALDTLFCAGAVAWNSQSNEQYNGKLTHLDVSNNKSLRYLRCSNNRLASLNVSDNSALSTLWCYGNPLTELDLSGNAALTELICRYTLLTSLDVSQHTALVKLDCYSNPQLASLDVSGCTALAELSCGSNQLTSLDVSGCTALTHLTCNNNQLTSLDVSGCTALADLSCGNNQLTSLDLSKNTELISLNCTYEEHLTSIDISGCSNIENVTAFCNYNCAEFKLGYHPQLTKLYLAQCRELTSLDLSGCPNLEWISTLGCETLQSIDYRPCPHLKTLYQDYYVESSFNICDLEELTWGVDAERGGDFSFPLFPHLKSLSIWHFTSLDLSCHPELETLWVGSNNCTTLDLSPVTQMKSLTVDGWSAFEMLDISKNLLLENVTFNSCEALKTLYVAEGQTIKGITVNRSDEKIHPNTRIMIAPGDGGGEGSTETPDEP